MTNPSSTSAPMTITPDVLESWAIATDGPVALSLTQELLPVELDGDHKVIYPPTYADIGYNIDTLCDGTKVALVDSVGAQANRMEPMFQTDSPDRKDWLVPQIRIRLPKQCCGVCDSCREKGKVKDCEHPVQTERSLLDLAHRAADAVVHATPTLAGTMASAFASLRRQGDAGSLCAIAPTSLVFGVWDSRGVSGEKRPRLVRSIIRAWDVEPLTTSAQFNSVWKELDDTLRDELTKEAKKQKKKLSDVGLNDAPATNTPGGVRVRGSIRREVTVNLVALRGLRGSSEEKTKEIRRYLLSLALLAATKEIPLYLREGCHLRYGNEDAWFAIPRRGAAQPIDLTTTAAEDVLRNFANESARPFRKQWQEPFLHDFDVKAAKKLLARKVKNDGEEN